MRREQTNHYETECTLECTDNGKKVSADVDQFKEKESITVLIEAKFVYT
jgi:hypothetical protein